MEPTSHFIQLKEIRMHYVAAGAGLPVILLHGFPEFWYSWRNQIPVLAKRFKVIAPDLRGYNLTDKPEGVAAYTMDHLAGDIADLIAALGYSQVMVVGHDWGAAVAWALAAKYPGLVKKLVILNVPHPDEMKRAFREFNWRQMGRSWYMFFFQLPFIPDAVVGRKLFFQRTLAKMGVRKTAWGEEELQRYVEAFAHPGAVRGALSYYRAVVRELISGKTEPLPKIQCPVMMLWGEQDKALGKELTLRTRDYCSGGLELHYEAGSGHFIQQEHPEWVNGHLMRFLSA